MSISSKSKIWRMLWRVTKFTLLGLFLVLLTGIGAVFGYAMSITKDLKPIDLKPLSALSATTFIYDRNQQLLGQSVSDGNRIPIKNLSDVSHWIVDAFISGEDKTFYSNIGIDPMAILRSAYDDFISHQVVTGASTISQQTIKTVYFPDFYKQTRDLHTKIQEAIMAIEMNRSLSKDQIMTDYLNWVYFGKSKSGINLYGIQSASKAIFGIPADQVNVAQAALLASLPNNPANLNPFRNLKGALDRQHYILTQMKEDGYISKQQFADAMNFDIKKSLVKEDPIKTVTGVHPYLIPEIEQRAAEDIVSTAQYDPSKKAGALAEAKQALDSGGYKVYTTIDLNEQNAMEDVLSDNKNFPSKTKITVKDPSTGKDVKESLEVGTTLIDNKTGGILAVGGGRSWKEDQNNHTLLPRQPGSSMKPLAVYGPAVEQKIIFPGEGIDDVPFSYPGTDQYPQNWDHQYRGWVSARVALAESYDVPALKLFQQLTPKVGLSYVKQMGITTLTPNDYNLPAGIGGLYRGLTVEENTSAYTTFANQGIHKDSYLIDHIVDREGNVVYSHQPEQTRVFSPQTAFILTDMMKDVVHSRIGTAYRIGSYFPKKPIAGKTGTTNSEKDIWFIGYTPDVTLGVWEGYDIPYPLKDAHNQLSVWKAIMDKIYPLIPNQTNQFPPAPAGVQKAEVFFPSGKLPTELDQQYNQLNKQYTSRFGSMIVNDWFTTDKLPTEQGDMVVNVKYSEIGGKNYFIADPNVPVGDSVKEGVFIKTEPYKPLKDGPNYSPPWDYQWETPETTGADENSAVSSPEDLKAAASANNNQINLTWSNVQGADGYVVWRADGSGQYQIISNVLSQPDYVDKNTAGGSSYSYKVSSVKGDSLQLSGNAATGATGGVSGNNTNTGNIPTGLAVSTGPAGYQLAWNPVQGAQSYNIYRSLDGGITYLLIGSSNINTYDDTQALGNAQPIYYVTAETATGESAPSLPESVAGSSDMPAGK
ncbi:transglycosylase domain-containing protein [Paenibacillus sp. sptzw28]|uniref:transglycosylase domain-containing protein n=1 Tax=Paenibacillus sp. sptzw28 TaxID=715179 RepID=UPI001C6EC86A|nr:transglycosylase domain-containing protein [Paenibacillus sp. sptzw28]QYR22556.1 transglycosylase domain-containing protein [Paenibacillus sp. sptzw28]